MNVNVASRAIKSYRTLLRVERNIFGKDTSRLLEAMKKTRNEFEKNKLEKDAKKIDHMILTAEEAADFLSKHVVQAVYKTETKAYEVKLNRPGLDPYLKDPIEKHMMSKSSCCGGK